MREHLGGLVLLLGMACAAACAPATRQIESEATPARENIVERVGDMELTYNQSQGVALRVFDVPVLTSSQIAVMTPGWGQHYYVTTHNMTLMQDTRVEDHLGGRRVTILHRMAEEYESPFTAVETHTLLPGNVYQVALDFHFASDKEAIFEWRAGGWNPNLVAGMPFRVLESSGSREGVVPYVSPGPGVEESTVARAFSALAVTSRLGEIVIEADPDDDLILFDYRKNVWASDDNPWFWFGYLDRPIPGHKNITYAYTIRLPETLPPAARAGGGIETVAATAPTDRARVPNRHRDFIIPKPKSAQFTDARMTLGNTTAIYIGQQPGAGIEVAVDFLLGDLQKLYGLEPPVLRAPAPDPLPAGAIVLGETARDSRAASLLEAHGLSLPEHREGYALHVDNAGAVIAANTEAGVFYGVTTLVQLIGTDPDGVFLRGAAIRDYPSLDFRGVHALSSRHAGDQIARAVRDLLARYKMNTFVWECQYIVWDCCPELEHPEYGMRKDDARKVVEAADRYFVELVPLVQSLGHSEWIFTNGNNLDIAEDPETPYAYSPTNPRTYDFIFTVYQEALDLFRPRIFHIGHDEVTMRGRFPYRSKDSGLSITDLILMDTLRLHEWFRERDVRVAMWGDMFLHQSEARDATFAPSLEEARARRARLPKDILITDWHYHPVSAAEYTSIPLWRDEGFDVVGSAWFNPANIHQLALACIRSGVLGFLQTTWAGFNFAIDGNESAWFQYWAYITAAHYAWSGDETSPDDLPFNPKDEFLATWFPKPPLAAQRAGFHVDLRPVFNRALVDPDGTQWLGYGPDNDFSSLPTGDLLLDETTFRLDRDAGGAGALLMAGKMNPAGTFPSQVRIALSGKRASELRFLMTTAFATRERSEVGRIEVHYTNGEKAMLPLVYGSNIFAFGEARAGAQSRIAFEGQTRAGTPVRLWDIPWENPAPDYTIEAIVLVSNVTEAAPLLFAITGVE